jgi:dimethylargininase
VRCSRALVCPPAPTFAAGLTSAGRGPPDLVRARQQHAAYCGALERFGVELVPLAPDSLFPDGTFTEDPAVVVGGQAILARPGAPARRGEVEAVRRALAPWFPRPEAIADPGTLDGGDVCLAGHHVLIGQSERTNAAGAAQLAAWLRGREVPSTIVDLRGATELLHLKTGLSWLGGRRLLAIPALAAHPALEGWELLPVPEGEAYAANVLPLNGAVLMPSGCPRTAALLAGLGHAVVELEMSEFEKMDGGVTCLSLRW